MKVLNAKIVGKNPPNSVYVGRPSKWGNPFIIGKHGNREEVVEKYGRWICDQPELLNSLDELKGKDLVCWCAPNLCHAMILIEW
jgi:hypothetical protein